MLYVALSHQEKTFRPIIETINTLKRHLSFEFYKVISLHEDANNCLAFQFEPSLRRAENYRKRSMFFKQCQVKKVLSVNICRTSKCQSATDPESEIFKHKATYANKFDINKLMWLQVGTILIS